ncbi:hypothetical protein Taro_025398 [Colocasia esculenta]|uniref:BED-type domain-containing protein n=1 Tax=Colocasia esculenta TaxID=4460 RepID=A0A843V9B5_COLES|nr:hypothetical protein [Colocasia esculenta]
MESALVGSDPPGVGLLKEGSRVTGLRRQRAVCAVPNSPFPVPAPCPPPHPEVPSLATATAGAPRRLTAGHPRRRHCTPPLLPSSSLFMFSSLSSFRNMAHQEHEEQEVEQAIDPSWAHGTLLDARQKKVKCNWCSKEMFGGIYRLKQHIVGISGNVAKCPSCQLEVRNEMKAYMKGGKTEKLLTTQQQQLQDEISGQQIRRDYTLPINVDDDEDDDPDPEFTAAARASRRSYAEEDERRRGLGTSGSHLSRDDSRRSLPKSTLVRKAAGALGCGGRLSDVHAPTQGPMDTYLYRSRSVKQPGIKQALKGVKATAKGAIKGILKWFLHAGGEVLEPQEVMGLGVSFQDMRIIQYHPINNKEAKGKHNNNMGDMKANKGKQGMIGDMGLLIHPFLVPQNCHIQISALVVGLVTWAIFKLLGMVVSSLQDNQEKV